MPLPLVVLAFIFGIFLCIKGANFLVSVASKLQSITGLSEVTIGITLMAIVTSLPETVVAMTSAFSGESELAVGSAIGSIIFNIAVVLSVYLVARPIHVERKEILWKAIFLFISVTALFVLSLNGRLGLFESLCLCLIFVAFIIANRPRKKSVTLKDDTVQQKREKIPTTLWWVLLAGAGMLLLGAYLVVSYSEIIGSILRIPKNIMAIVLIATGISLPELFIAIMAVHKKQSGLALGNIIGSCIINSTLVLGSVGLVSGGLAISLSTMWLSLPFIIIISLIALLPILISKKTSRISGFILFALYILYVILLYV